MDLVSWGILAFAALNLIGFAGAAYDKHAAGRGRRRLAERTFQLLALYGAWLGILVALVVFRHKTRKGAFLVPFAFAACANILMLALLAWFALRH